MRCTRSRNRALSRPARHCCRTPEGGCIQIFDRRETLHEPSHRPLCLSPGYGTAADFHAAYRHPCAGRHCGQAHARRARSPRHRLAHAAALRLRQGTGRIHPGRHAFALCHRPEPSARWRQPLSGPERDRAVPG
jgi:hypothetical protein